MKTINDYRATADSVGDWDGDEQKIANLWNERILPILAEQLGETNPGDDEYDEKISVIDYLSDRTWSEFCGSENIEDAIAAARGKK